jgi:hypothetical protein
MKAVEYVWEQSELSASLAPLPQPAVQTRPTAPQIQVHAPKVAAKPHPTANRPQKYANDFVDLRHVSRRPTI